MTYLLPADYPEFLHLHLYRRIGEEGGKVERRWHVQAWPGCSLLPKDKTTKNKGYDCSSTSNEMIYKKRVG